MRRCSMMANDERCLTSSDAAMRSRLAALIAFMDSFTLSSGTMSVTIADHNTVKQGTADAVRWM